ncbi:MAG: hypothetical protein FJX75_11670 [Armatimonadetes bacterium]|nr:hypothetical protein [Armatimonadota bacterium]
MIETRDEARDAILRIAATQPERAYRMTGYDRELKPSGKDLVGICPFHQERNGSFHITTKGEFAGRCKCFGCGFGGDLFAFLMRAKALSFPEALDFAATGLGIDCPPLHNGKVPGSPSGLVEFLGLRGEPPSRKVAEFLHGELLARPERLRWLAEHRCWSEAIVRAALVGWYEDGKEQRFSMPVLDGHGEPADIRLYRPRALKRKCIGWREGTGSARLYGLHLVPDLKPGDVIYIAAGEPDCLALNSLGFPSITNTDGEGNWPADAEIDLAGVTIYILEDHDAAGRKRTPVVAQWCHKHHAEKVLRVTMCERGGPRGFDATDLVVKAGGLGDPVGAAEALARRLEVAEVIAPARRRWQTPDLLRAHFPPPRYLLDGILCEGVNVIGGQPKIGKSLLGTQGCLAISEGGDFLGCQAQKGRCLYLAYEDGPRRLQGRLLKQGWTDQTPPATFLTRPSEDEIHEELDSGQFEGGLLVVDTLSRWFAGKDQLDAAEMTEACTRLQEFHIEFGLNLWAIDHHKKGATGDPVGDLFGSVAKAAGVDGILGLYRDQGKPGARLKIVGRDVPETELVLTFDPGTLCWRLAETGAATGGGKYDEKVLAELTRAPGHLRDLHNRTGISTGTLSSTLHRLEADGKITGRPEADRVVYYVLGDLERERREK